MTTLCSLYRLHRGELDGQSCEQSDIVGTTCFAIQPETSP